MASKLKIGITGGIGSGKSLVSELFALHRVPIFNADKAAKFLMDNDSATKEALLAAFGNNVYVEGRVNRPFLASIVFNNSEKLALLNSIVHPSVGNYYANWHKEQDAYYTLKEAAIIFESGSHQELDYVIGVTAPVDIRIKRVMLRDNITEDQVKARMANQMDEEEKMKLCNFVIHNDEQDSVILQVNQLHHTLISLVK